MTAWRSSFDAAAPLASLWTPHAFVDAHTFLTVTGHVGAAFRLAPRDGATRDTGQRERTTRRFEGALRLLDVHTRLYQFVLKRPADAIDGGTDDADVPTVAATMRRVRADALNARQQFVIDQFLVLVDEDPAHAGVASRAVGSFTNPFLAAMQWLSPQHTVTLLEARLRRTVARLHQTADAFRHHVDEDLHLTRLDRAETFLLLCDLVSYDAPPVPFREDLPLHRQLAREGVTVHRTHLEVGRQCVQVLTLKDAPRQTRAYHLEALLLQPFAFCACLEWIRLDAAAVKRDLTRRQKHFNNKRRSPMAMMLAGSDARPDDILHDDSAEAMVRQLGALQTDLDRDWHFVGACALTIVVHAATVDQVQQDVARVWSVLSDTGGAFLQETGDNQLRAWGAIVPGGEHLNVRYLPLLETNAADLSVLFTIEAGDPEGAVAVFETAARVPYHWHLAPHGDDTRHGLMLGSSGAGKSTLLNWLLLQLQALRPQIVVLDVGHSYRRMAEALGGSYVELGLEAPVPINPFALPPTTAHLHFLAAWCKVLMAGADGYQLTREQDAALFAAIENVYALPNRASHRLSTLARLLKMTIPGRLDDWVQSGRFAPVFDNVEDRLELADFQVFEFGALREFPALVEPLQFYVVHRTEARLSPDRLTVCVMDELESLLRHHTLRAHVESAMPGWRKLNGAMVLATQHVEALTASDVLQKVVENCQTTYFLAADHRDRARYAATFGLNERELDLLDGLQRKRQCLLSRRDFSKVLDLTLTADELALCSQTVPALRAPSPCAAAPVAALTR